MGVAKELNDVDKGFEIVARHKMNKLPIILSEADPEVSISSPKVA